MKTFQEFILECELQEQPLRDLLGATSVTDYPSQNLRNLSFLVKQQRRAEDAMAPVTRLPNSSYQGRLEAGRNAPGQSGIENPNYQGPSGPYRGIGSRMPGTTPSPSPFLPKPGIKSAGSSKQTTQPSSVNRFRNYI